MGRTGVSLVAALWLGASAVAATDSAAVWEELRGIEANPLIVDPGRITALIEECRELGDRACEARALLARAECLNQSERVEPQVGEDAVAAEAILEAQGPDSELARALLLRRWWPAGPGERRDAGIERLDRALEMARRVEDRNLEGRILCELANLDLIGRDFAAAHEKLAEARRIAESGDYPRVAASETYHEAFALYLQGRVQQALDLWERASAVEDLRGARETLWTRINTASLAINALDRVGALSRARHGRELADRVHGAFDRAKAYINLVSALNINERYEEVEQLAPTCLELSREAGLPLGEAICQRATGLALRARGEAQRGLELCRAALRIDRETNNQADAFHSLLCVGSILTGQGKHEPGRRSYDEAIEIADRIGWPGLRAHARNELSDAFRLAGRLEQSEALADEALALLQNVPDPQQQAAWAFLLRGTARHLQDDHGTALEDLRQAFRRFAEAGRPAGQARAALRLGSVYFALNRMDRALDYYRQAVALARQADSRRLELMALGNIALIDVRFGRLEEHREEWLAQARNVRDGSWSGGLNGMLNVAEILTVLDELEAADWAASQALERIARGEGAFHARRARRVRARILSNSGRHAGALAEYEAMLAGDAPEAGPRSRMYDHLSYGQALLAAGRPGDAVDQLRIAVRAFEEARGGISRPELRATFLSNDTQVYVSLVGALLARAGPDPPRSAVEEAFAVAERSRAWTLIDALAGDPGAEMDAAEVSNLEAQPPADTRGKLLSRMAALHLEMMTSTPARGAELLAEIRGLEDRLGEISSRPRDSALPAVLGGHPTAGVRDALLDDRTALVEYHGVWGTGFVFIATRDGIGVAESRLDRELYDDVLRYRALLQSRSGDPARDLEAIRLVGSRLYGRLIEPVEPWLDERIDRLVIVPTHWLHKIPFEALVLPAEDGNEKRPRYLVQRFEIDLAPSLAVLAHLRTRGPTALDAGTLVAMANPRYPESSVADGEDSGLRLGALPSGLGRLPHSEDEVRHAADRVGGATRILTGEQVTELRAREVLESGVHIVHFATHGFLDDRSIGRSGLLLTPQPDAGEDGLLQAREITGFQIDTDLVVLSGCSTGGGTLVVGEGLIGLPHALFQAGAPSVVMSLWEIRDRAAAVFMDRFYAGMSGGEPVGRALRRAKLDLIASGREDLAHPSVWAPFVLAGVYDRTIPTGRASSAPSHGAGAWIAGLIVLAVVLWISGRVLRRHSISK